MYVCKCMGPRGAWMYGRMYVCMYVYVCNYLSIYVYVCMYVNVWGKGVHA